MDSGKPETTGSDVGSGQVSENQRTDFGGAGDASPDPETSTDPETTVGESDASDSSTETDSSEATEESGTMTESSSSTDDSASETTTSDAETSASETTGSSETSDLQFPTEISLGEVVETVLINDSGQTLLSAACTGNQVLTSLSGKRTTTGGDSPWITGTRLQCSALGLSGESSPATSLSPGPLLDSLDGGYTGAEQDWSIECPAGKALLGLAVRYDVVSIVEELFIDCGELIYEDESSPAVLVIDNIERLSSGGILAGTPDESVTCPAGHLAVGARIRTGFYLYSIGLSCRAWSTSD